MIQATGLTKEFSHRGGTVVALRDATLTLPKGELAVALGPSGSGKSTLLNLIGGLDRPTSGSLSVGGTDLASLNHDGMALFRREHVGFLFQAFHLLPTFTVYENVTLPLVPLQMTQQERANRVTQALDRVGIAHRAEVLAGVEAPAHGIAVRADSGINTVADLKAKGFEVKADDITNFMAVETGGTFSPSIRSGGAKDGAVGLAQFTGTAIDDMNRLRPKNDQLTRDGLAEMGFDEQSKVVTEYLSTALSRKNMQGKEISGADLYTAVFSPAAIGKPMNSTIYDKSVNRRNYNANRSLDTDKDGKITKAELTSRLTDWANRGAELRG